MNLVDLLVLVALIAMGVRGHRRGLVQEGVETAAALGALLISVRVYSSLAEQATLYTGVPLSVTGPIIFVTLAVTVASIGFGVAALARQAVAGRPIWERVDGWGGLAFGACKAGLIALILLVLAAQAPYPAIVSALESSLSGRAAYTLMPEVYRHVDQWLTSQ